MCWLTKEGWSKKKNLVICDYFALDQSFVTYFAKKDFIFAQRKEDSAICGYWPAAEIYPGYKFPNSDFKKTGYIEKWYNLIGLRII